MHRSACGRRRCRTSRRRAGSSSASKATRSACCTKAARFTPSTTTARTWASRSTAGRSRTGSSPATGPTPASPPPRVGPGAGPPPCPWHHARFDLCSGGTFDQWADELRRFPVELDGGEIYVDVTPRRDPVDHQRARLQVGLERDISLVVAKAAIVLTEA